MASNTEKIYTTRLQTRLTEAIAAGDITCVVEDDLTQWAPSWATGKAFYMTLVDPSANREIVKVTGISGKTLTITRGQDGSTARAWEAGTLIEQRLVAADAGSFIQKAAHREVGYNPNGALTAAYPGEKVVQLGVETCRNRWWKNISGTDWQLIAGLRCDWDEIELIESLNFSSPATYVHSLCHVSGDVYAIAHSYFEGGHDRGRVSTLTISSEGDIGASVIDTGQYQTAAREARLLKVNPAATIYAPFYMDPSGAQSGEIATMDIANSGIITTDMVDNVQFNAGITGYVMSIFRLSANYVAVVYSDVNSDGWIKTYPIDDAGSIGAMIDSLEFDADTGAAPSMVHVSGDVYAIAYAGPDADGWICTVSITATGTIAFIEKMEFDSTQCYTPSMILAQPNVVAIAYKRDNKGYLATVGVSDAGVLTDPPLASLIFDATGGHYPFCFDTHHPTGLIGIAYNQTSGGAGYLQTYYIKTDGTVEGNARVFILLFSATVRARSIGVLHLGNNYFAVVYATDIADGWIKTFKLT